MGLKNKAFQYKKNLILENFDSLDILVKKNVLTNQELILLKEELNNKINFTKETLDRKIIDLQTVLEISKELVSNLKIYDLIQILLFTIIGHFDTTNVAIFLYKDNKFVLQEKKGFPDIPNIIDDKNFISNILNIDKYLTSKELKNIINLDLISNSEIIVPLKAKNNKNLGILLLGKRNNNKSYTIEDFNFIEALSSMSAVALENANLYEDLKNAYDLIERKYNELSTLYEISKIINSTTDFDLILSLLTETITTGFGVKKAIIFIKEENSYLIKKVIGLNPEFVNQSINLSNDEIILMSENRADILLSQHQKFNINELYPNYLFLPLITGGKEIGGIMIYSFENYDIDKKNQDLINLMMIIGSQIAPPLMMAQLIKKEKEKIIDPFNPLLNIIESEINKISKWDVGLIFTMINFNNFKNYIETYDNKSFFDKMENFISNLKKEIPASSLIYRYTSNKIFILFRGLTEIDFDEIIEIINTTSKNIFNDFDIGLEIKKVIYNKNIDKFGIITELE